MEKRKYMPRAVYDALSKKLKIKRRALKDRIYKGDLVLLEMAKSELEKYDASLIQKAADKKAQKLQSKQIREEILHKSCQGA